MSKYTWAGSVMSVDLEDKGAIVVADLAALSDKIKLNLLQLGLQTKVRNFTAGKMDDPAKGRKAMEDGVKELIAGNWGVEKSAAVELSPEERTAVIDSYLVDAKRSIGDKRPNAEIIASFRGLTGEQQTAILAKHERNINKRLKAALAIKKGKGPKATDDKY